MGQIWLVVMMPGISSGQWLVGSMTCMVLLTLKVESKVERGLENDFTGALLCPSEWNWDDQKYCHLSQKDDFY